MATPLDFKLERHAGPEPRVLTADVQAILHEVIRPGDDDNGASVTLIAEKARISPRTVYRVLTPDKPEGTLSLDLADRLCLAADAHLNQCSLRWPDGSITPYSFLPR